MTILAELRPQLADQLCRILEDTAFMLVDNPEAELPRPVSCVEARLSFTGKAKGTCWLVVSENDASQLATEMLGSDEVDGNVADTRGNAVGELLNILTAWLLDSWWGDDVDHDLGVPVIRATNMADTVPWSAPPDERVVVQTDSGCTFVSCVTLE